MPKVKKLEHFQAVLARQAPQIIGEPMPMKTYDIEHPKDCGIPTIGAYSKHGFWYKLCEGKQCDYDKIVALSYETDSYYLNYESFNLWQSMAGNRFQFIVAKNLEEEVIGSVGSIEYNGIMQIGLYYVQEEYRHSGIGLKLFVEIMRRNDSLVHKTVLFHPISWLTHKLARFGLFSHSDESTFFAYYVENGSGFEELNVSNVMVKKFDLNSTEALTELIEYDSKVAKIKRPEWIKNWLSSSFIETYVSYDSEANISGYGSLREVAGGYVKRIVVGPLVANTLQVASAILNNLLKKYYNIENDYDWNPDIFALYRRSVHFILPSMNVEVIELLNKLRGEHGTIQKERVYFQTFSSKPIETPDFKRVFVVSDLHLSFI